MDQIQPELIEELRDKLREFFIEEGIEEPAARRIAFRASEMVRLDFGGQTVYFPKGRSIEPSERDLAIYRRFNGDNRNQLCREFNLSTSRLYQIINFVSDYMTKKNQLNMFPEE